MFKIKTAFYFLIVVCAFLSTVYVSAKEEKTTDGIFIGVKETIPPGAPHMPAYNPFYAEMINGNVLLGCVSSYGVVDVNLTSTAGDDYSTVFDTSTATIIIPTSGNTGDYTLLITTSSGLEFIGEFSL